jgi:outer membrane protein assembly factor BamB
MGIMNNGKVKSKKSILFICLLMFLVFNADGIQPDISSASINQSASALWSLTATHTNYNATVYWSVTTIQDRIYAVESEYYNIPGETNILYVPYGHSIETLYTFTGTGVTLWNFTGNAIAQPTIVDKTAYVAGGLNTLYALDANSGMQKWSFAVPGDLKWHKYVDNMLYLGVAHIVTGEGYFIYALNATTGQQIWRQTFRWGDDYPEDVIVDNGIIYFGHSRLSSSVGSDQYENEYFAVNTTDGSNVWKVAVNGWVNGPSALISGLICFSTKDAVYALNAASGSIAWSTPCEQGYFFSPTFGNSRDIVYAVGHQEYAQPSDAHKGYPKVYALNALTGKVLWSYITKGHDVDSMSGGLYSLDIVGETLFLMMDYASLYAVNTDNGQELWSHSGRPFVVDSNVVYFFADNYHEDKKLEAVDASNGQSLWNCSTPAHFITAANKVQYFYVDSTLYALNISANSSFNPPNSANRPTPNPSPTSTLSPAPSIPELSWFVIIPLLLSMFTIAAIVKTRKNH